MEPEWWHKLDKHRGSRPRCVLLCEGSRKTVAARLTELVGVPEIVVAPDDIWMPHGKPVQQGGGWDKSPAAEARLDRDAGFVTADIRRQLRDWWLAVVPRANTPNWDIACTCEVEGKRGLILVEAKAHAKELHTSGKSIPGTDNGWKNHDSIAASIAEANASLQRVSGGDWRLSRDDRYQLANRFAWAWKLASLGIPVVLIYLGFLDAEDMAADGELFRSPDHWASILKRHARGCVDESCWGRRLDVNGVPFRALIRAVEQPFLAD